MCVGVGVSTLESFVINVSLSCASMAPSKEPVVTMITNNYTDTTHATLVAAEQSEQSHIGDLGS